MASIIPRAARAALVAAISGCIAFTTTKAESGKISVGRNVQISKDRPGEDHGEPVLCASITDPHSLIAAATSSAMGFRGENVYYSADGGNTWSYTMDTYSRRGDITGDPACAASPTGAMQFTTMHIGATNGLLTDRHTYLLNYLSHDGGKTWSAATAMEESAGVVREFTTFDTTEGAYHGRDYVFFNMGFNQRTTQNARWTGLLALGRSLDDGTTWQPPAVRAKNILPRAVESGDYEGGTVVVGPDGVISSAYIEQYGLASGDAAVYVVTSHDGAATLDRPHEVGRVRRPTTVHRPTHPILAVDRGPTHRGRLYVTWCDVSSGRMQVVVAWSDDGGELWTTPAVVAESDESGRQGDTPELGPFHPWLSVNNDGVVGIMWLDPKEMPKLAGFNSYFTASLDGGETWLRAVKVSEAASLPILRVSSSRSARRDTKSGTLTAAVGWTDWDFDNGDLTWMDTDLNGRFWPVWTDARTGVRQIWTSPITVSGAVARGNPLGQGLAPISEDFAIEFGTFHFQGDRGDMEIRLKNVGHDTLKGPLMIRALDMTSGVADDVRATNSDNGESGRGAIWDFTALVQAGDLQPGAVTDVKRLTFRLVHPKTPVPSLMENSGLTASSAGTAFSISFEVLGAGNAHPQPGSALELSSANFDDD